MGAPPRWQGVRGAQPPEVAIYDREACYLSSSSPRSACSVGHSKNQRDAQYRNRQNGVPTLADGGSLSAWQPPKSARRTGPKGRQSWLSRRERELWELAGGSAVPGMLRGQHQCYREQRRVGNTPTARGRNASFPTGQNHENHSLVLDASVSLSRTLVGGTDPSPLARTTKFKVWLWM